MFTIVRGRLWLVGPRARRSCRSLAVCARSCGVLVACAARWRLLGSYYAATSSKTHTTRRKTHANMHAHHPPPTPNPTRRPAVFSDPPRPRFTCRLMVVLLAVAACGATDGARSSHPVALVVAAASTPRITPSWRAARAGVGGRPLSASRQCDLWHAVAAPPGWRPRRPPAPRSTCGGRRRRASPSARLTRASLDRRVPASCSTCSPGRRWGRGEDEGGGEGGA